MSKKKKLETALQVFTNDAFGKPKRRYETP